MLVQSANALSIGENVQIKPNSTSLSYYKINSTVYLGNLTLNQTHANFNILDASNQTVKDVDTGTVLCSTENCSLVYTDSLKNVTFTVGGLYFSLNSTNSTFAGVNTLFSLYLTSNAGLSGFVFQFCNGTWNGTNCVQTTTFSLCFQETANISTSCGGLSTGAYNATTNYFYINYTKPTNAVDGMWQIKHGLYNTYNITIPDDCFNSIVMFRFYSVSYENGYGQCFNGSEWKTITNVPIPSETWGYSCATNNTYRLYDGDYDTGLFSGTALCSSPVVWALCNSGGCLNTTLYEEAVYWNISLTSGGWVNDSFVSLKGTGNWSNVTKIVNNTVGSTIGWKVWANNTIGQTNESGTFSYNTTAPPVPDMNLSFGPPGITTFDWDGCDPDAENASALPFGQTSTYGIDLICNNGTATGNVDINISGSLIANWTIWVSNVSTFASNLTLSNGAAQRIYNSLTQNSCVYLWFKANCSYAHVGPGVYEMYWMSVV